MISSEWIGDAVAYEPALIFLQARLLDQCLRAADEGSTEASKIEGANIDLGKRIKTGGMFCIMALCDGAFGEALSIRG